MYRGGDESAQRAAAQTSRLVAGAASGARHWGGSQTRSQGGQGEGGQGTGVLGWGQGQLAWPAQHSHSSLRTRDSQLELGTDSQISDLQLRDAMGLLTVCTCKPRLTRGGAPGRVSVWPRGVWVVGGWVCRVGGRGGSINNKSLIFYNILVFASTTSKIGCRRGRLCVGITAHTD